MKDFVGKTCVVTGAGSGIGRALASKLAAEGALLALADVNAKGLQETADALSPACAKLKTYPLDVSNREAVYAFAAAVEKDFGHVDVVINNAGVALSQTVIDMQYADFEWLMNINFWGVVYGTKAFLPILMKSPDSYLVNISSIFGMIGVPTQSAYNASKFAVRGFTEALRLELDGTSVKAICVHPGGIRTNIARNARFFAGPDGKQDRNSAVSDFDKVARTTPDEAAAVILKGIRKQHQRVLIGADAKAIDVLNRLLPEGYSRVLKGLLRFTPR